MPSTVARRPESLQSFKPASSNVARLIDFYLLATSAVCNRTGITGCVKASSYAATRRSRLHVALAVAPEGGASEFGIESTRNARSSSSAALRVADTHGRGGPAAPQTLCPRFCFRTAISELTSSSFDAHTHFANHKRHWEAQAGSAGPVRAWVTQSPYADAARGDPQTEEASCPVHRRRTPTAAEDTGWSEASNGNRARW